MAHDDARRTFGSAILHRGMDGAPPVAVAARGCWIEDADGRRYLDGSGGAAVSCLGHGHPAVAEAIRAQLDRVAYVHSGFFTSEPAERLARRLLDAAPAGFRGGAAVLLGSGSEAIEASLKLSRQYFMETGHSTRGRFIAREMSYHGATLGALSVGGHTARRALYAPLLLEAGRIPAAHHWRHGLPGESEADYGRRAADALEAEILRLGPDSVAACLAEPVPGAGIGCVPAPNGYFARVREICDRHGVLLIADEVMCGMGRTGSLFAMEQEGVAPDMIALAKGLGAGYQPIAALLASEKVAGALRAGSGALAHGQTYMSHAVACAAGLAVLDVIEGEGLVARVQVSGRRMRARMEAAFADHPHLGEIRGRGLFHAIEFVADPATRRPFPAELGLAERLKRAAMAEGLVCYPCSGGADGRNGDHVILAPPYIATEAEVDEAVDRLHRAVDRAFGDLPI